MRMLLILVVLFGVACEREAEKAPATAAQTTSAPEKNLRALPPDKQLLAYYQAMAAGHLDVAYEMVHEPDREAKSYEEFRAAASDPLQMKLLRKRSYEIKNVVVDGKTARVDIDTTGPDVAKIQKELIPKLVAALGGDKPSAEGLKVAMERALDAEGAPMVVTNNTIYLAQNEADEWKLDFDWDAEHPGREVPIKRKITPDAGSTD